MFILAMNCVFIKNVAKLVKIPVITLAEIKTKKFSYHRDGKEMISALLAYFLSYRNKKFSMYRFFCLLQIRKETPLYVKKRGVYKIFKKLILINPSSL